MQDSRRCHRVDLTLVALRPSFPLIFHSLTHFYPLSIQIYTTSGSQRAALCPSSGHQFIS